MSLNQGNKLNDVVEDVLLQAAMTVTTSQIELKVGGSPAPGREVVRVYNKGDQTIYVGPSGVTHTTGEPVFPDCPFEMPIGNKSLFAITESGSASVIVWEIG